MKTRIIYCFAILFCLTTYFSCSSDTIQTLVIDGTWDLRNVSGGLNGINDDYPKGIIKWVFNSPSKFFMTIENNNFQNPNYNGLDSGIYKYSVLELNNNFYLIIDGSEFGGFVFTEGDLIINQNETSSGSGADKYILKFEKESN
jgi:hypothetical protein